MGHTEGNCLKSIPNFRLLECHTEDDNSSECSKKIFRSSRPDFLSEEEAKYLQDDLGIRTIIDLRSSSEYKRANGEKLLDSFYPLYKLKLPFNLKLKQTDVVNITPVKSKFQNAAKNDSTSERKHIFMDFFKMNYVWAVYNRGPWYIKLYSLLFLLLDLILQNHFVNFVRCYARNVLNKQGLTGQYLDMITYSQGQICAALKVLSEPGNVPALINCAHGKDRTGIVSAMVLGCMGKSKEYIAYDYARSETELAPMKERLHSEIVDRFHMCQSFTTAKAETMMTVLDYIDETYGSIENYLEFIGFGAKDQEKLRKNLQG